MEWYIKVLQNYANFKGRARRKEYWMFLLTNFFVAFGLGFVIGLLHLGMWPSQLYQLAILIPSVAVGVRRMHDTGRSGWWLLLPLVNLYFLCLAGTRGDNRFGTDPKGTDDTKPLRRAA